jgi:cytochrome c oxidase subunit III
MAAEAVPAGHDAHAVDAHEVPHHDYHIVDPSPWPATGAFSGLLLTSGLVMWMHSYRPGPYVAVLGILGILTTMFFWWRDVLREGATGHHKDVVSRGLRMGMGLFITSEVLFFFAFFWAFFWGALYPPATVATSYPPEGITPVPTWQIPFLNTMILLLSGTTVTWAHHAVRDGDQRTAFKALLLTVCLGITFTSFQAYEYVHSIAEGFTLQKGVYGSTFYMATGFHGFHVIVGTTFLLVCTIRAYYMTLNPQKHVGLEAAAWYWHFVDVVWLFLFVWVYWWGGGLHFTTTPAS